MGVPAGHPFFGNQYTNGGYIPGTYTYVVEKGKEIIKPFLKESSKVVTHGTPKQKLENLIPKKLVSKDFIDSVMRIGGFILYVAPIALPIINEHLRNKTNEKQNSLLSINLQNVGTCTNCGEPLIDSTYVPESGEDAYKAYIICKKCGEKNFARYSDNNDSETLNADE